MRAARVVAIDDASEMRQLEELTTKVIDAGGNGPSGLHRSAHASFAGAAELDHLQLDGVPASMRSPRRCAPMRRRGPDARLLLAQGADYTILSIPSRSPAIISTASSPIGRSPCPRPTIIRCGPTPWRSKLAGSCTARRWARQRNRHGHGRPGNGELREVEAFGPMLDACRRIAPAWASRPAASPIPCRRRGAGTGSRRHQRGLDWCARHGITSIHNMDGNLYKLELLSEIEDEGNLICRAGAVPLQEFHDDRHAGKGVDDGRELRWRLAVVRHGQGLLRRRDRRLDGVMVDDYADRPGLRGEPLFTPEQFTEVAVEADRRGLQIAVHAIGDGAVRAVLNGYEAARRPTARATAAIASSISR